MENSKLNFNSSISEIRQVFRDEEPKAQYWMRKRYQGDKGYDRECQRLANLCYKYNENCWFGDVMKYIAPKSGNIWISYIQIQKSSNGLCYASPTSFVFFETVEFMGCIIGTSSVDDATGKTDHGWTLYTPHFFRRFKERMKEQGHDIDFQNKQKVVVNFTKMMSMSPTGYGKNKDGTYNGEFIKRLPASWAKGDRIIKDGKFLDTVRTFYTDKTLTQKQTKELMPFAEFIDSVKDRDLMLGDVWEKKFITL